MTNYHYICVICDDPMNKFRDTHNAGPLKKGRCCEECNEGVIIPFRTKIYNREQALALTKPYNYSIENDPRFVRKTMTLQELFSGSNIIN